MTACMGCLRTLEDGSRYHARCLRDLFGSARLPDIDVELAKLHTLALAMVGHTSLSGVQRKISLGFETDRRTLQVAVEGGRFILKPQAQTFPALPENEHVTMRIAERVGLSIPPCALVVLKDGTAAYVVKRFDRLADGRKLLQEDFCQLAGKPAKDKYEGSAELCVKLVNRFASAPPIEAQKLFRLLVFAWWTGNGDMHLKNFSLLRGEDGHYRMSPVYDLLSTRLVIPGDQLALPVGGTKDHVGRRKWHELGERCGLPRRAADRVLRDIRDALDDCIALVEASFLPEEMKRVYQDLLRERTPS
jgi:serine/threonine-protein kinase HipA